MKGAVTKVIDTLTQEDFHGAFQKLLERYKSALQLEEISSKRTRVSCVYFQEKCPYEKSLETYFMILVYIKIHSCVSTVSMSKSVQFQIIQFSISTQFKCKYSLIVKNISYFKLFSLIKQF